MPEFFLGVDAGATKTHALLMDQSGLVKGVGVAGCGNHETSGHAAARDQIQKAIQQALHHAEITTTQLTSAAFCLAGVDIPCDSETVSAQIVKSLIGNIPYLLKNDSYGCLRGGTKHPHGVMVNCGTAQVAVGKNTRGEELRIGGYGGFWGDFTGGGAILAEAIAAVCRAEDGRAPNTLLTKEILDLVELDTVQELINSYYRHEDALSVLPIPQLVFKVSCKGDRVARGILQRCADEVTITATTLISRLGMQNDVFDVVLAGSVFKGEDPWFVDTITENIKKVAPMANPHLPIFPPVVGAALLAIEMGGIVIDESCYQRLSESLTLIG